MPREDSQIHPVNHTGFSSEVLLPGMTGSSALKQLTPNHHQKVLEKREAAADKWKNETRPDSCVDIFQMDDIHNSDISAEINDDDEEELDEETADGAGNGEKSPDDGDVFAVLGCGGSRDWSKKRQSSNESRKSASQGIRSQENNEEAERLFRMIEKKDEKGVEEILSSKKINLSSRNAQGDGFVMAAVQTRCLPLVETLLSAGADVNAKGAHHSTALHVACGNGDYDTARRLLAAGADPNCAQDDGSTPLHCACQPGDSSRLVQLLLDSGATVDATCTKGRTSSGYTAVHLAAEVGDANTVRLLVDRWPEGVGAELSNAATPLHVACRHGYQEVTRQLLERGARTDALARDLRGHDITPLHMAIENIHLEPVRTLIEAGANVDAARVFSNRSGVTALHLAVLKRNLKIVQLLLDAGCRINDQDSDGSSALHLAARVGHHAITDELLKRGADINLGSSSKNSTAQTPLHAAVRSRHVQIAKLLISYGSNVNQPEKMVVTSVNKSNAMSETGSAGQPEMGSTLVDAYTPLHWAVENKDLDMVCTLLDNGALPNPSAAVEEHTGLTPLHLACQDGYDLIARELLRCEGCDRNPLKRTLNRENITPLHQATYNGHVETVKVLLESDCDVNIQADNGYCALHYAAQQGNLELTKMILKHRGDVRLTASAKDQEHISALHLAVQSGNPSVVKALVEAGADINSEKTMIDIKGVTPLHQAVYQGKADIVELLLELGASVNASMGGWYTALHVAAEKGCAEIVTLLLRHSADVNAKASHQDHIGLTPLHVASQHGHTEVARQLIEAKANLQAIRNFSDRYGITALHLAAEYGFEDTVRALADLGCDLDAQDSLKFTPLHVAIQYNFPNIVSFLLDAGCDPKLKTVAGLTPSKMAEQNGNAEIRQIFKEKKRKSKSISFRRHSVNSNHSHANSDNNIMNSDRTTIEPANNNEKRMSSFMRLMCGLNKSS